MKMDKNLRKLNKDIQGCVIKSAVSRVRQGNLALYSAVARTHLLVLGPV